MVFETYKIEMVSPPPTVESAEIVSPTAPEEVVVERPEEAEPVEPEPTVSEARPAPRPEPERPADVTPPPKPPEPEPEPEPEPSQGPNADPASPGGENMNIRMEGLRRDYPAYYGNIVRQIARCFRWTGGGRWETVVFFSIRPDGTVDDMRFVRQSGSTEFDYEALGAVDCAGRGGKFGAFPDELRLDRLPIQFSFRPAGADTRE